MQNLSMKKETLVSIVTDAFNSVNYGTNKKLPNLKNDKAIYGSPKFITPRGSFFKHVGLEKNIDFKSL